MVVGEKNGVCRWYTCKIQNSNDCLTPFNLQKIFNTRLHLLSFTVYLNFSFTLSRISHFVFFPYLHISIVTLNSYPFEIMWLHLQATRMTLNIARKIHFLQNLFILNEVHARTQGKMNGKFGIIYRTFPTCVPAFRQFFYITIFSIRKVIFFTFHGKTQK